MIQIIKVGGAILFDKERKEEFLETFASIAGKKILVHGGGRSSSEVMRQLNVKPKMVEGRRITDEETLGIVTNVYAGINKQIVASLQAKNVDAVGLCGADANLLRARRRPPEPIDYGFVGDIEKKDVHTDKLHLFLKNGFVPVFAALTHDGHGSLLNTNADTIASVLSQAMQKKEDVRLIYTFEKKGLLRDVNDDDSLIENFSFSDYQKAKKEEFIHAGMIPKLDNAFAAVREKVKEVVICNVNNLTTQNKRTLIVS